MRSFVIVLMIFIFSGCTSRENQTLSDKMIVVALSAPPSTLDPRRATDATGERITRLLYGSFVHIGPDLKPVPEDANTWKQDGTKLSFQLKPHLRFSNGREVTPEDVDYSIDVFRDPKSLFASSFSVIKSAHSKQNGDHIETDFELTNLSAIFLSSLGSLKILPKKETLALTDQAALPVGSGPFVLESQTAGEITLRARTDHPYANPRVPGLVFKIVRDDNTRVQKMLKGELDLAQAEFPPAKIAELERSDHLKVYKYPGLALTYLLFNLKDPALAKIEVRRAVALAIDRPAIIQYKLGGLATLATSLLSPLDPFFDSSLKPIEVSLSRAKLLLANVGALPTFSFKTSSAPAPAENGRVIANDLEKAGLKINLQSFEWGTFYGDVQNGRFQLATLRWTGTTDPDLYRLAFHSSQVPPAGRNRGGYVNADVDAWTEEGARTVDFAKRKEIYLKVQRKVFEDLPFVPLWYDTEVAVVSRRLIGYEPPRDGSFWNLTKVEKK